ncbi:hypothetical protein B0T26DRAFT_634231 [Lasiosphaeria miniovina]|uniref:Zn(2)-C6 fungal-type domain-containing protein n=1 Tax=Lasiosphaeria miniovina TaxID=1954250 RepID=A0AA40EG68_9PEZI|nr:uncharacterized protein B0T26DRAFT_634231 [Lasiosphaeria miniovina]KAK0734088.1 hypothetical protein B0T26DRAFT_634231 [Lasiosphaeria miniovina]
MSAQTAIEKADAPKRRACDECRTRKLACSKEADGCSRCKREGVQCNYSLQKPMGRPRKRAHVEVEQVPGEPAAEPLVRPFDSTFAMDLELSFLDMDSTNLNFLDLLGSDFLAAPLSSASPYLGDAGLPASAKSTGPPNSGGSFVSGDMWNLANIDFDALEPAASPPSPSAANKSTLDEGANFSATSSQSPDTVPGLSPPSTNSPKTHLHGAHQEQQFFPTPVCICLSSLYLALDSLRNLPTEVGPAMMVARTASRTAHDAVLCPVCGMLPLEPCGGARCKTPVSSLQTMMMLGALLPSLASAYMQILDLVEAEAARAGAEGRKMTFNLKEYGGVWGQLAATGFRCEATKKLDGSMLEPGMWRLIVRALLKMDVYGTISKMASLTGCRQTQPGLKDIIEMMEDRSRTRHEELDALVDSGAIERPDDQYYIPLSSGEKPTCLRIIDIAKKSMDDLVIP